MGFDDIPADERHRLGLAVHEAGHAVVSTLHGGQVIAAETYTGGPRTDPRGLGRGGLCQYTGDGSGLLAAHRAPILAAGTAAQAVWLYGPRPTLAQLDALMAHNREDATELRRMAVSSFSLPYSPQHVLPTILRTWPGIARLAMAIHKGEHVGHTQVCTALGFPSRDNEMHRSHILNGGTVPRVIAPPTRHLTVA